MTIKENEKQEEQAHETGKGIGTEFGSNESKDGGNTEGQSAGQGVTEAGSEAGNLAGGSEGSPTGAKKDRGESKRNLIESIRNKKHKRDLGNADEKHGNSQNELQGISDADRGTDGTTVDSRGVSGGTTDGTSSIAAENGSRTSDTRDNREGSSSDRGQLKKAGVEIKTPDLTKLPSVKSKAKPIEQKDVKWEDVLTKKEATELKPRIEEALATVFKYADKGIEKTTKRTEEEQVFIWSTISTEEISVIALSLIETGQRSQVVATATRRVARDFTKFQLGIIMLPRLYLTVMEYVNKGFANPFGGKKL